jgi:hypothetical protein
LVEANSSEAAGKAARGGRVVITEEGAQLTVTNPEALSVWLLAALGGAFAIVGLTDLALLWWPLGFGNAIWEFGTLSTTFDSVPMWGLGAGLIVFAVLRSARTRPIWVRVLAVACVVVVLIFLVFALVYVTATPDTTRSDGRCAPVHRQDPCGDRRLHRGLRACRGDALARRKADPEFDCYLKLGGQSTLFSALQMLERWRSCEDTAIWFTAARRGRRSIPSGSCASPVVRSMWQHLEKHLLRSACGGRQDDD